jgi:endonuclease-3
VPENVKRRCQRILNILKKTLPQAIVELNHHTPFQLLIATILSAQCTDERVNSVTPALFQQYPGPSELAQADPVAVEAIIRPTGFFRSKAKNLIACGQQLMREFQGNVPQTMEELTSLPGIGRKTANVMLGTCFGKPAIIVDTHVKRVANRLDFTSGSDPTKIEAHLQSLFPQQEWTGGSQRLLLHGRYVCVARKPKCEECVIYEECSWKGKVGRC